MSRTVRDAASLLAEEMRGRAKRAIRAPAVSKPKVQKTGQNPRGSEENFQELVKRLRRWGAENPEQLVTEYISMVVSADSSLQGMTEEQSEYVYKRLLADGAERAMDEFIANVTFIRDQDPHTFSRIALYLIETYPSLTRPLDASSPQRAARTAKKAQRSRWVSDR